MSPVPPACSGAPGGMFHSAGESGGLGAEPVTVYINTNVVGTQYPASTRAVRSLAGTGCPASFARKHAAATAIEALDEARPASCSSAR